MRYLANYSQKKLGDILGMTLEEQQQLQKDLNNVGDTKDALANFYNGPAPKDEKLKEVYKCIGKLNKTNRLLEIPMFQTDEQFEGIINKKVSPDEILQTKNICCSCCSSYPTSSGI